MINSQSNSILENEYPYLIQKEINAKFFLKLDLLPEIKSDYIFNQVLNYSKIQFLRKEIE